MPVGFAPTKSAAHRLACRALYKNLLTACTHILSEAASSSKLPSYLQSLVRYRFCHDRTLQPPKRILDALQFGRKALQLLREASTGSPDALTNLTTILRLAEEEAASIGAFKEHISRDLGKYPVKATKKQQYMRQAADPTQHLPSPGAIPILNRPVPLAKIEGKKRFVPQYRVTQGIPFLKYGKKQPHNLSLYIRDTLKKHEDNWQHKIRMENMAQLGRDEDDWDQEMQSRFGVQKDDTEPGGFEGSWGNAFHAAGREAYDVIKAKNHERSARGEMLWDIMLKERALAEQEKQAAKRKRKQEEEERITSIGGDAVNKSFLGE